MDSTRETDRVATTVSSYILAKDNLEMLQKIEGKYITYFTTTDPVIHGCT
jgi:hypothetical protein